MPKWCRCLVMVISQPASRSAPEDGARTFAMARSKKSAISSTVAPRDERKICRRSMGQYRPANASSVQSRGLCAWKGLTGVA